MRGLSASEIVGVWERGRGRTLPERAVDLLVAGGHAGALAELSAGERDALLFELRAMTCGRALAAIVICPSCGDLLELELASEDLLALETARAEPLELEVGERTVRFRLPTAGDLVAVGEAGGIEEGRAILLERCVGEALSPDLEDAVATRMALADPGAWTDLALACPGCEHEWATPFDVVSFFWAELEALARRLVRDVHELASAYGWRESDVLALSAERREAYLELIGT